MHVLRAARIVHFSTSTPENINGTSLTYQFAKPESLGYLVTRNLNASNFDFLYTIVRSTTVQFSDVTSRP